MKIMFKAAVAALALAAVPTLAQGEPAISASKAVAVAEKALTAQATETDLDAHGGRLVYEIELVRGDSLYEASVDAQTGRLIATDRRRLESLWASWFDKARLRTPAKPLSATLAALEAETDGRVDEVSLETEGGRAIYEIELTTAAGTADIAIDPATGKRLPAALAD